MIIKNMTKKSYEYEVKWTEEPSFNLILHMIKGEETITTEIDGMFRQSFTKGKYRIVFSAECEIGTDVYIMLDDNITLYRSEKTNRVQHENIVRLEDDTLIQFVCGRGYLKKISIDIQKTPDNR